MAKRSSLRNVEGSLTRRLALTAWLAAAGLIAGCASAPPRAAESPAAAPSANPPSRFHVYLGTYTSDEGSQGIYRSTLDARTGQLGPPVLAAKTRSPSFLAIHPGGRFLYAVGEFSDPEKRNSGAVTAYAIAPGSGELQQLNQVASEGAGPCYVTVHPEGKTLLVANYGGGTVASFPIQGDGHLGPAASAIKHEGSSVNPGRQKEPHAHSIIVDPRGRRAYAADLGIDKVMVYRLGLQDASLAANDPPFGKVTPGGGPRHLTFHPSGKFLYTNNELTSSVTVFAHDAETGALSELQTITSLPEGAGKNSTAQILTTPDGRFLYVSNRGHDSVAMFAIDQATGRLTALGHEPTQGKTPRNFNIDPTGNFLLAANQGTNNVVAFRIDPTSGRLRPTGHSIEVSKPVCVQFVPATP